MKKRTRAYWKKRFREIEEAEHRKGADVYANIEDQFRKAEAAIESKIEMWYARFAENNEISYAEAKRWLDKKELAELKWDVNEYIKHGEENALSGEWTKELVNASSRAHISRLESLKLQLQQEAEVLYGNQLDEIDAMARDVYKDTYYRTAFAIQQGFEVGWDLASIDPRVISKVINKPWAADGRDFSERVWSNRRQLVENMNTIITQNLIRGEDPQKAIDQIAKKMNTSKQNAGRLVMTEEAAFSSAARQDCFKDLGVKQFQILATLDSHTSELCRDMDGKVFKMSDYEVGVTAPPFHVYCRTTTIPYFEDDFGEVGERAARDETTGKTYYVPADMTYREWQKKFVNGGDKSGLTGGNNGNKIVDTTMITETEKQRAGRNKSTAINKNYIDGGEYRKKFNAITDNVRLQRSIYEKSKEMLNHRTGTLYEDMYWFDPETGEVVAKELSMTTEKRIDYSETTKRAIAGRNDLWTFHTHPDSFPPSADDFNSYKKNNYSRSFIICHDGTIYEYSAEQEVSPKLFDMYTADFMDTEKISEREAQLKAVEKLMESHAIRFKEVRP